MVPFIIALLIFIGFMLWMALAFKDIWIALFINGIPLLLIALRSWRDLYYYREFVVYTRSAAAALLIMIVFYKSIEDGLLLVTDFAILTFMIAYLLKGWAALDKAYKISETIAKHLRRQKS